MSEVNKVKAIKDTVALFIIVNAGFNEQIIDLVQDCGAKGATIIPGRGTGAKFTTFLGMHYEPEREIILSVLKQDIAIAIMQGVKEKFGQATPTNGICFTLPVEDATFYNN